MHEVVQVPKVLKVQTQRLKGAQKWDAKVVFLEGCTLQEYIDSVSRGRRTCLNIVGSNRYLTQMESLEDSSQQTLAAHSTKDATQVAGIVPQQSTFK